MFDTSHLQELRFNLQSEDSVIPMVALINQNKLPTGVAIKCIEEVEGDDAVWAISLIEWACSKRTIIEADTNS